MADTSEALINGVNPTATGTFTSTVLPTRDKRDFALFLLMPSTAGSGADTLDITIQESDQRDFADPERIRTVEMRNPNSGATVTAFTQVTGGVTSPNALLQQKLELPATNYNRFIRAQYVIAGTATNFTDITLLLVSNTKV